jgi:hypothetical protein
LFADSIDSEPVDSGNLSIKLEDEQQRIPPKSSNVLHPHNMQQPSNDQPRAILSIPNPASCRISEYVEADTSRRKNPLDIGTQPEVTESVMQLEESIVSDLFSLSAFSHTELMALVQDTPTGTARIKEVSKLLRTLVMFGECQLEAYDRQSFLHTLNFICGQTKKGPLPPIKYKDAVGRKFSFPWHLCKSWKVSRQLFYDKYPVY